jgi:hypothetical protein
MRNQVKVSLTISILRVARLERVGENDLPHSSVVEIPNFSLAHTGRFSFDPTAMREERFNRRQP